MLDSDLGGLCRVSWVVLMGRGGGTNSEDVDVAFDGALGGREDVDGKIGVEACDSAGGDWDIRDRRGRGNAEDREGGGEECEFHGGYDIWRWRKRGREVDSPAGDGEAGGVKTRYSAIQHSIYPASRPEVSDSHDTSIPRQFTTEQRARKPSQGQQPLPFRTGASPRCTIYLAALATVKVHIYSGSCTKAGDPEPLSCPPFACN